MIAALALRLGVSPRLLTIGLVLLAIGAALLVWRLWLSDHDAEVIGAHETKIGAQIQAGARTADQNMVERREERAAAAAEQRKDFEDATVHLPASGLSARQRVDACRQLRAQGEAEAILARAGCL